MMQLIPLLKTGEIAEDFAVEGWFVTFTLSWKIMEAMCLTLTGSLGLDPLMIDDFAVYGKIELKVSEYQIFGLSNLTVETIRVDLDDMLIEMQLMIPQLTIQSMYSLTWTVGPFEIESSGNESSSLGENNKITALETYRYLHHQLFRSGWAEHENCTRKISEESNKFSKLS